MRRVLLLLFLVIPLTLSLPALAVLPGEQLTDPVLEARARKLSAELRCLVCQNQSIDDSDAALATDLRRLVRERIVAGDNDAAIRAFLVARYGEFVLLKPGFSIQTIALWLLPGLALLFGLGAARKLFRRGGQINAGDVDAAGTDTAETMPPEGLSNVLSDDEKREIAALLSSRKTRQ